jgi:excisionase family DNA binding protein
MTDLLTPEEAAKRLHVSTKLLRRLRRQGDIRYVAITDRKIRFRPEDCEDYLESRVRQVQVPHLSQQPGRRRAKGSGVVVPFTARR